MKFIIFILFLVLSMSCNSISQDSSDKETLKKLLLPLKDDLRPYFLTSCKMKDSFIFLLVINNGQAVMGKIKEEQVSLLSELTFSSSVSEPLIETNGGFEMSKQAKEIYSILRRQKFDFINKVDYPKIMKAGVNLCEN